MLSKPFLVLPFTHRSKMKIPIRRGKLPMPNHVLHFFQVRPRQNQIRAKSVPKIMEMKIFYSRNPAHAPPCRIKPLNRWSIQPSEHNTIILTQVLKNLFLNVTGSLYLTAYFMPLLPSRFSMKTVAIGLILLSRGIFPRNPVFKEHPDILALEQPPSTNQMAFELTWKSEPRNRRSVHP